MTTEQITTALFKAVKAWGLGGNVYKYTHPVIKADNTAEWAVVNVITAQDGSWTEGFANVNIFVPDLKVGYAAPDAVRLGAVEAIGLARVGKGFVVNVNDEVIRFKLDRHSIEEDGGTFSHFVNIRLHFQYI